jgi:pantothenate kinase
MAPGAQLSELTDRALRLLDRAPAGRRVLIGIAEGNYLLLPAPEWRAVASWFDEVWFCQLDDEVRRARLISRHVQFGKTPDEARDWVDRLDQANARLVAAAASAADLLVLGGS